MGAALVLSAALHLRAHAAELTAFDPSWCATSRAAFERPAVQRHLDRLAHTIEVHRAQRGKLLCDFVFKDHALYRRGECLQQFTELHLITASLLSVLWYFPRGTVPDAVLRVDVKSCAPVDGLRDIGIGWCGELPPPGTKAARVSRHGVLTNETSPLGDRLLIPGSYEAPCSVRSARQYSFTLMSALLKPAPDAWGGAAAAGGEGGAARLRAVLGASPAWSARTPLVAWRGSSTGRRAGYFATEPDAPNANPRLRAVLLSADHPSSVDARMLLNGRTADALGEEGRARLFARARAHVIPATADASNPHFLSDGAHRAYRYLLDVDGDGCSGRFSRLFAYGAVVLKAWSMGSTFLSEVLRPWVHYAPVRPDLADLLPTVKWLRRHDELARELAANGSAAVLREASPMCVAAFWRELAAQYARRAKRPVQLLPDDELVPLPPREPGGADDAPLLYRAAYVDQKRRPAEALCHAPTPQLWARAALGAGLPDPWGERGGAGSRRSR